ncbi:MAG: hypothetical protein ACD_72C00245G0002 [uncultured bacterium]|nr:MAG: hypothetical protein ACD_72C00245G0002 [uncultured bacterium]
MINKKYQVLIAGGGITGTSLLYTLSKLSNIKSIALLEKNNTVGTLNTSGLHNSQTLHFGDIETNYTLDKAKTVNAGAQLVAEYLENLPHNDGIFMRNQSMLLAVGEKEVAVLHERFEQFKNIFPNLKKLERNDIAKIEPKITQDRDPKTPILALLSTDRYTVDYQKLSQQFIKDAQNQSSAKIDLLFNTKIKNIQKINGQYVVTTDKEKIEAEVVVVALGAHSLMFAKQLGYGLEYALLPIIGDYYSTITPLLNGKVYTIQNPKLPFAAIHGDPNILDLSETRFGPTALSLPILERGSLKTFFEFLRSTGFDLDTLKSLIKINSDKEILKFIWQNFIYTLPLVGRRAFIKTIAKIIPSITLNDLKSQKGRGGIRPQLVNKKERHLLMGSAEIAGDKIIFNVTPSPGATACLQTAQKMAGQIINFLESNH